MDYVGLHARSHLTTTVKSVRVVSLLTCIYNLLFLRFFWLVLLIVVGWYHTIVVAAPAFPRAVDDQRGIAPGNEH